MRLTHLKASLFLGRCTPPDLPKSATIIAFRLALNTYSRQQPRPPQTIFTKRGRVTDLEPRIYPIVASKTRHPSDPEIRGCLSARLLLFIARSLPAVSCAPEHRGPAWLNDSIPAYFESSSTCRGREASPSSTCRHATTHGMS